MNFRKSTFCSVRKLCLLVTSLCLSACILAPKIPPGVGPALSWRLLPGWSSDQHADSLPALLETCSALGSRSTDWANICSEAKRVSAGDHEAARLFYEQWFTPHAVMDENGQPEGLLTGYYEPLLSGSRQKSEQYHVPAYAKPKDIIQVDLSEIYPELKAMPLRGQLVEDRLIPYLDRQQITSETPPNAEVLVWLDDPIDLFFLQIQGSGRVSLDDGSVIRLGYADQNGHPYHAIGRELADRGAIQIDAVNMFSIRDWLETNPEQATEIMNTNPSYVFFVERESPRDAKSAQLGPIGSLNVHLSAERSIAIDPSVIAQGSPIWVDTTLPVSESTSQRYRRLMMAQDTGGAIKGYVRADIFFGTGERARQLAGLMKQSGRLYVLKPKLTAFPNTP